MNDYIIAIDPGTKESGVVIIRWDNYEPVYHEKLYNGILYTTIREWLKEKDVAPYKVAVAIEMIQGRINQGFGSELLETAVWIGRFTENFMCAGIQATRIYRMDEYKALCANIYPRNDKGVKAALVDRFAYGKPNYGKGTKKNPGWFYGFTADVWQAYAVGVTFMDMKGF